MAHGLPRTRFSSASLVRVLADLQVTDEPESRQSFADRVGQWLDFRDALSLFSVLNANTVDAPGAGSAEPASELGALRSAVARARGALADSITADEALEPRVESRSRVSDAPVDSAADFASYHRYYLARQRDMNASIGSLRASVRAALSRHSAPLKRLAALDAALDQALSARERDLLATVPGLLAKRFEQLRAAHRTARDDASTSDDPHRRSDSEEWLAEFRREMRAVLLAELDLRLQPVVGLIAALHNDVTGKQ